MKPPLSTWWLFLVATGCDAGRGAPRLVPAPPLPASGIVLDLGSEALLAPITTKPLPDRSYAEATDLGGLVLAPGGAQFQVDVATSGGARSADRFVGDAYVIDFRSQTADDLGAVFDIEALDAIESSRGPIRADEIVVLVTGYDRLVPGLREAATAYSAPLSSPGVSGEVMRRLVVERGVRRFATDAPSVSPTADRERRAENVLLSSGGFAVTGLCGLERLPPRGATLIVAPLDLAGRGSAPVRALAIVPRK